MSVEALKAMIRGQIPDMSPRRKLRVEHPESNYDPLLRMSAVYAIIDDWAAARLVPAEDEGRLRVVDDCINIVQQSLDTVRHEVSRGVTANPPYVNASIAAREHVIRLLTSYRAALAATPEPRP